MKIRVISAALMTVLFTVSSVGAYAVTPASPAPQFAAFAGHWNCTASHRERSYVALGNELFVRTFQKDGNDPLEQFRLGPESGGFSEFSSDGEGTGTFRDDGALVMTGEAGSRHTPVVITTRIDGNVLTRQVARGGTASFEMCTREVPPPPPAGCDHPNVRPGVLTAAIPRPPSAFITGVVFVRLVLDDRSNVIWSAPIKSDSVVLDESAVEATHRSTFRTTTINCVPMPAEYIFTVDFSP